LQEFLSMIDLLSIHFPLTPETRHLICAHPCNK
jgi:phosphoglycerate dehydrogenase-like enzyme